MFQRLRERKRDVCVCVYRCVYRFFYFLKLIDDCVYFTHLEEEVD